MWKAMILSQTMIWNLWIDSLLPISQGLRTKNQDESEIERFIPAADEQPESSSWATARISRKYASPELDCLACGEKYIYLDVMRAPCGHLYCRECLAQLFRSAMSDESLFPPRCCQQNIPLRGLVFSLPKELIREFRAKEVEFSTPRRTYCHQPECSAFIPPKNHVGDIAICMDCGVQTCITCKGPSHNGDCPDDKDLQEVLELAQEHGWQQCYNCLSLIELSDGCYHMTCKCRSEFCYLCGTPWKNCDCRHWDEYRIRYRAGEIYRRDHRTNEQFDIQDVDIGRIVTDLRENHECGHSSWRYRSGNYRCEECRDTLPSYIFECCQCNIMACRRCRYNRL
ncbi:IBR finger domain-containing protein [Daldinia decipiens]|uniref:IBR finger domain-containing protein n=1 Tax=Daldinia decipiens TaxID=326647 RepID=UPI0020C59FAF|nr:IBR finger domain-containing protein [Daldinia decipiens]KAI1661645.1 IBR finger domain-containing protein [Daldinia decipiens]